MIDDVFVAGFANFYTGLTLNTEEKTSQKIWIFLIEMEKSLIWVKGNLSYFLNPIFQRCDPPRFEFNESRITDIMETTRFLNQTDFNLDHWPIWKTISTVFEIPWIDGRTSTYFWDISLNKWNYLNSFWDTSMVIWKYLK